MSTITRRSFICMGGAAAAVGATAAASVALAEGANAAPAADYKAAPAPIGDDQISEIIDCDVCVIGGGVSGSFAAATAAEEGANVVVLQKAETAVAFGSGAAAWNSKVQQEMGAEFDPWEAITNWTRQGENRADLRLLKTWIYNSGPTIDWAMALTQDVEGVGPVYACGNLGMDYPDFHNFCYPVVHAWAGEMGNLSQWMLGYAESLGATVLYSTPAKQIVRGGVANGTEGRVEGVIAQREDGSFIKVNAANAVILAAGDYGNNPQMRAEYLPHAEGLKSAYPRSDVNTGDGQLMGMWVGGFMQLSPHASNIHYDPPVDVPNVAGTGLPWLFVNQRGERFCNEDMEYGQLYAQDMNQPGYCHYQIFDDNYRTDWEDMGSGMMKKEPPMDIVGSTDAAAETGDVARADTIEELAALVDIPAETLVATVERYNELCDLGYDDDFGKQAARLKPIRKPPFYAAKRRAGVLCTLNGIVTDGDYRALDKDRNVIEGLYAVGNCQGNFFGGLEHPMIMPGMSIGRAMTTGRVAGLLAAGKEINRGR